VLQREHGTYLRADIRGARGFSSGGETHWTLGKAKASESSRRQPSSAPSLTRNRRNRSVPSAPSSTTVIFDPRDALSLPLRCSRYSANFLAIAGKSHPHIISENLVYDSNQWKRVANRTIKHNLFLTKTSQKDLKSFLFFFYLKQKSRSSD